ncbi:MAG: acyl carrier protein [Rhodocyclaceae bacterium]|nr:acyl carrier protein [Rhodocyclaceae bacterium]
MSNQEKYRQVFIECFGVEADALGDNFTYQCVPAWDSVGHMGMIAALEDSFGIMMETDDIVDFSSYTKGMELLGKYGITF